jgi:hypothetical protein
MEDIGLSKIGLSQKGSLDKNVKCEFEYKYKILWKRICEVPRFLELFLTLGSINSLFSA